MMVVVAEDTFLHINYYTSLSKSRWHAVTRDLGARLGVGLVLFVYNDRSVFVSKIQAIT